LRIEPAPPEREGAHDELAAVPAGVRADGIDGRASRLHRGRLRFVGRVACGSASGGACASSGGSACGSTCSGSSACGSPCGSSSGSACGTPSGSACGSSSGSATGSACAAPHPAARPAAAPAGRASAATAVSETPNPSATREGATVSVVGGRPFGLHRQRRQGRPRRRRGPPPRARPVPSRATTEGQASDFRLQTSGFRKNQTMGQRLTVSVGTAIRESTPEPLSCCPGNRRRTQAPAGRELAASREFRAHGGVLPEA